MRDFEILFDKGEPSPAEDAAYGSYGWLGFPPPPADRPWTFTNFVQSLDGIVSFQDRHTSTADIAQSPEDRWLMDLLRAHADAVILGVNTLVAEAAHHSSGRGFVYRIQDESLRRLRQRLGRGREMNIFVTGAASLDLGAYRVFDGEHVDAVILTTKAGSARLGKRTAHPHVRVIVAGEKEVVDLPRALTMLRQDLGIRYLLCEGGPTLNGHLQRAGLVDEKFLTISPVIIGQPMPEGKGLRPTVFASAPGFTKEEAPWWRWISCRKVGDHEFNRYRRR